VNSYDWRADYGNSSDDVRHRFVGHYVWQLPFFGHASNAFVRGAAGGWALNGIVDYSDGQSGKCDHCTDRANTGQTSQRPDLVGKIDASRCGKVLIGCVSANAFALPVQYTYGNAGRNLFYAPGLINFATSLRRRSACTSGWRSCSGWMPTIR